MALSFDNLYGLLGKLRLGSGPAKDNNKMTQPVNNVSEIASSNDYTQMQALEGDNNQLSPYEQMRSKLAERYGESDKGIEDIMARVAFHETGPWTRMDPSTLQKGGGPGRGLFQFKQGEDASGMTAMRRLRRYFRDSGQEPPSWTDFNPRKGVDASKLSKEQQKMLFLANVRYHPTASLSGITSENLGEEFWAPSHWAGAAEDKDARLRSFDESMGAYDLNNEPTAEEKAFPY